MNAALLEPIVQAVLYEGYILYPYRASSKKNRRERFTFGRVYPEAYSIAQKGAEPCRMETECLVISDRGTATLEVGVRFLQPMAREIGELLQGAQHDGAEEPNYRLVPELRVGEQVYRAWLEAVERRIELPARNLLELAHQPLEAPFGFPASRQVEFLREAGQARGVIVRRQAEVAGTVKLAAQAVDGRLFKITVRILNRTSVPEAELDQPDAVLVRTLAATHTILNVQGGAFVSLLDPGPEYKSAAATCENLGTWPVLVGDEALQERDTMLSSPIILYDYPQIAPESAGTLFDGTEIDELLTLRIRTLTDNEKLEMRQVDEQARHLLQRAEALPEEGLLKLHGTLRTPPSASAPEPVEFDDFFGPNTRLRGVSVGGKFLQPGDRVRIRPKARADVLDLALSGQIGIIEAVEQDLEKRIYLALVIEKDPGRDLGLLRQPGHRFFYGVEEVEPVESGALKPEASCEKEPGWVEASPERT